jgi:DNA-binding IclR family transcriptional regulator
MKWQCKVAGVLARTRFNRFTPRTLASRATFEAELRRIRKSGFAIDDEEYHEGIRCIAPPVFAFNGRQWRPSASLGRRAA